MIIPAQGSEKCVCVCVFVHLREKKRERSRQLTEGYVSGEQEHCLFSGDK